MKRVTTIAVLALLTTVGFANADGAPNSVEVSSFPFELSPSIILTVKLQ